MVYNWWKNKGMVRVGGMKWGLVHFFIAVALTVLLIRSFDSLEERFWPSPEPDPNEWFHVEAVRVPNFSMKQYNMIKLEYVREVRVPFTGTYRVAVLRLSESGIVIPPAVCTGSGTFPYSIHPYGTFDMRIKRFIGDIDVGDPNCFIESGFYRMETSWDMLHDNGERRVQRNTSNIFRVTE